MNGRRLYRSPTERVLGGVAGGVAEYFDLDPALVRVAWAILVLASGGIFFVLYLVMWFVVPEAPPGYDWAMHPGQAPPPAGPGPVAGGGGAQRDQAPGSADTANGTPPSPPPSIAQGWAARRAERRRYRSGGGGIVIGSLLVLVGLWFLARDWFPWLNSAQVWPVLVILVGVVLVLGALRPRAG